MLATTFAKYVGLASLVGSTASTLSCSSKNASTSSGEESGSASSGLAQNGGSGGFGENTGSPGTSGIPGSGTLEGSGTTESSGSSASSGGSGSSNSSAGSSSSGSAASGASAGANASASGSVTETEAGAPCDVTSTGGLPLTGTKGNYLSSPAGASASYGGFAYSLSDSTSEGCGVGAEAKACGTSVGCLAMGQFCGSGTTGVKDGAVTYGAGFGANLDQSADGGTGTAVTISGSGLTYTVSSVPPNSLEIEIKDDTTEYCYVTTAASATIKWKDFVEKCTSKPTGPAFAGTSITGVSFQARAGAAAAPYDFCVTALSL